MSAFTHPISELKTRFNGQQEDVFACTIGPSHFEQSMQALSSLIPPVVFPNFPKGSPWGGFSLDNKRGLIFFTTGNPEYWHVGTDRPGDNLYANSVVAFDLNEKKIKWHFQEISHDLWNLDLAAAPILTTVKKNNLFNRS